MEEKEEHEIRIKLSKSFKKDLDALARIEGTSTGVLAKRILKLYVRDEYYKKARELLNFEDRVGTAVLLELKPQLEQLKKLIYALSSKEGETEKEEKEAKKKSLLPKGEGNVIYQRKNEIVEEEDSNERIDEEKEKLKDKYVGWNFPVIAGLDYRIEDGFVVYEDDSVWSLRLGAWIHRGPKVLALKRKRDKELGI